VKELQSIVNYEVPSPVVSAAFKTPCAGATVLTGSCTAASFYWSSTSFAFFSDDDAWSVNFNSGLVDVLDKGGGLHVRAVRGGSL
jgi:Protein of unknown function (DUF1566)